MAKKKAIKKEVTDKVVKDEPVKLTLGNRVQHVRIYPKYNPLRK